MHTVKGKSVIFKATFTTNWHRVKGRADGLQSVIVQTQTLSPWTIAFMSGGRPLRKACFFSLSWSSRLLECCKTFYRGIRHGISL